MSGDIFADLAYFTECQLATVEGLRDMKRPPKGELRRHESIAAKMVQACREYDVPTHRHGRLRAALEGGSL